MATAKGQPAAVRPLTRGGGFLKAVQAVVAQGVPERVAIVAASSARLEFLKELSLRGGMTAERLELFVTDHAAAGLDARTYPLLILDPSVDELTRSAFKVVARTKLASCKVLEIKKWSLEPPI